MYTLLVIIITDIIIHTEAEDLSVNNYVHENNFRGKVRE